MIPVDFNMQVVTDEEMAAMVATAADVRRVTIFHKGVPTVFKDFGTFIVGEVDEEISPFIATEEDMVYIVPTSWTLGHLCKRLGMFPSITQATKNGKGGPIPDGFSQHVVKIAHQKGVITVYKSL